MKPQRLKLPRREVSADYALGCDTHITHHYLKRFGPTNWVSLRSFPLQS